MKPRIPLVSLFLLTCILSCSAPQTEVPTLDLSKDYPSRSLEISELMSDIHLVKLETMADYPIPGHFNFWLGEKHLIVMAREYILQYTSNGEFVRVLATQGRGPDEFMYPQTVDVNENEDLLYYTDQWETGKISVWNLENGKPTGEIPLPYDESISKLLYMEHTTAPYFLYIASQFSQSGIRYAYLSMEGEITDSVTAEIKLHPGAWAGRSDYLSISAGEAHFMDGDKDTLYRLERQQMSPLLAMHVANRYNMEDNLIGEYPAVTLEGSDFILAQKSNIKVIKQNGGVSMSSGDAPKYYFVTDKMSDIQEIDNFYVDYLGYKEEAGSFRMGSQNGFGILFFNALTLKQKMEEVVEAGTAPSEVLERTRQLAKTVKEDDNPYLLVGKIK